MFVELHVISCKGGRIGGGEKYNIGGQSVRNIRRAVYTRLNCQKGFAYFLRQRDT
jgi:hypothetical protein